MAGRPFSLLAFAALLLVLAVAPPASSSSSSAPGCAARTFSKNRVFALCNDLPVLGSTLHWTYDGPAAALRLAFTAAPARAGGWISWAINPAGKGMRGSQALLAFRRADGATDVGTYNVSEYGPVAKSKIAFEVRDLQAEYGAAGGGEMTIFATVSLPAGTARVNHVWQVGPAVSESSPVKHEFKPDNLKSFGSLDLLAGGSSAAPSDPRIRKRNIHGVLNAVSWGVLLPIGAIVARYLRTFKSADPAWFYVHVSCQIAGYAVGVAGWGTGLNLGSKSKGVQYTTHRSIGIALFCLATLQVFALFLRPNKEHKYRFYWNIYHHSVGYAVILLGIINVFKGLAILSPGDKWRTAYIAVIAVLGAVAVLLEAITWTVVALRRRKPKPGNTTTKLYDHDANGGHNGQQAL